MGDTKAQLTMNPFCGEAITTYDQFERLPFLEMPDPHGIITNRVTQQITNLESNFKFAERTIIIGLPGNGKTSDLFFYEKLLKEKGVNVIYLTTPAEDDEHFKRLTGENIWEISQEPLYILIDFPDTIPPNYKSFLEFVWHLVRHENNDNINLVFAMNISHYNKSFKNSEVLGKFFRLELKPLTMDATKEVIRKRLEIAGNKDYFPEDVLEKVYRYSGGVPRNIICACSLIFNTLNGGKINGDEKTKINEILSTRYIEKIIDDNEKDATNRIVYKQMAELLQRNFPSGHASSQEEFVEEVGKKTKISRATILKKINYLIKIGVFNVTRGGYNQNCKMLSIGD